MSWHSPDLLWSLLLVPFFAAVSIFAWRRRLRALSAFAGQTSLEGLRVGRSAGLRTTQTVLLLLGLALILIGIAGPQYGSHTRVLKKRGVDVVFALDFSKSMLARDVTPSRIERAKAEVTDLIGELGGDRVGFVAFAGETIAFPLSDDYRAASLFLRDLGPYDMPVGGTAIGRALRASGDLLIKPDAAGGAEESKGADSKRTHVVVLITDGEDHEGEPLEVAKELAAKGIKIYTVGIGSRTGEPIPTYAPDGTWTGYLRDDQGLPVTTSLTEANENALREIAKTGSGLFFRAGKGQTGLSKVRAELGKLRQEERKSRTVSVAENRFALVVFPAFVFLLLQALLPESFLKRKPRRASTGRTS